MTLRVIKPGTLTTLQDRGRHGHQHLGVVVGGEMDEWAHRTANILVNNPEEETTLEITLQGPTLEFVETTLMALCGARFDAHIGTVRVPANRPVLVRAGSRLETGHCEAGARAYLAVAGGFDIADIMGSKSTYLAGAFGGFQGRALRKNDVLTTRESPTDLYPQLHRRLHDGAAAFVATPFGVESMLHHMAPDVQTVHIMEGRHWQRFGPEVQGLVLNSEFTVSVESDRMGYRLDGPALIAQSPTKMISESVGFGTIQVPNDGQPIILMADRQTTGGYPKFAHVASVDWPLLAQLQPRQRLRFALISLADAQKMYLEREHKIRLVREAVAQKRKE